MPPVMSSCSDAELWKTFDGAKYNNSTGWLWGEMENVSDNLNKTAQPIQHCASVSVLDMPKTIFSDTVPYA